MKKKLLLIGALAILSTAAMGNDPALGIAITNAGKINNATDGMIKSADKLGIKLETVDADHRYVEAGKVQAEIFDKTVDVIATNRGDIANVGVMQEIHHETIFGTETEKGLINKVSESGDKITGNTGLITANGNDIKDNQEALVTKVDKTTFDKELERLDQVDEKLKEKDKHLEKVDATLASNMNDIIKHNNAIYEKSSSYAAGSVPEVKADVNRRKIEELEKNAVTKADDVVKNTEDIEKVEKDIYVTDDQGNVIVDEYGDKTTQLDEFRETSYEAITSMNKGIEKNSRRIDSLEKKVDKLEGKMNKGLAMSAATSSIVYPDLGKGDIGIGAGMGGYNSSQAVAIGLAVQPTENVRINTNVSTSDGSDTMYGAGFGYKFNVFGS